MAADHTACAYALFWDRRDENEPIAVYSTREAAEAQMAMWGGAPWALLVLPLNPPLVEEVIDIPGQREAFYGY